MAKTFAVNTPKGQVRLVDLPLRVFRPIEAETGDHFIELINAPASSAAAAEMLYIVACQHAGAEPEELSPARLVSEADGQIFELVDDEAVVAWNGDTALPESEGAPETTGSSGAPESSDGSPTK